MVGGALGVHTRELPGSLWGARGGQSVCLHRHPGAPQKLQGRLSSSTGRVEVKPVSLFTWGCCVVSCLSHLLMELQHGQTQNPWRADGHSKEKGPGKTEVSLCFCSLITYKWKERVRASEANILGLESEHFPLLGCRKHFLYSASLNVTGLLAMLDEILYVNYPAPNCLAVSANNDND